MASRDPQDPELKARLEPELHHNPEEEKVYFPRVEGEHPETWGVDKIRETLTQHGVDSTGCIEKEELLEKLHQIPEFAHWRVPKHPDAHEFMTHVPAPEGL